MSNANGALFKNTRKQGKQPDYTGKLTITPDIIKAWVALVSGKDEVVLDIAGWMKTSNKGTTYISLLVKPPFERDEAMAGGRGNPNPPRRTNSLEDEVPW